MDLIGKSSRESIFLMIIPKRSDLINHRFSLKGKKDFERKTKLFGVRENVSSESFFGLNLSHSAECETHSRNRHKTLEDRIRLFPNESFVIFYFHRPSPGFIPLLALTGGVIVADNNK